MGKSFQLTITALKSLNAGIGTHLLDVTFIQNIYTDNQAVYNGFCAGYKVKHGSMGDLWAQFWMIYQTLQLMGWIIILHKVKSHTTIEDMSKGKISFYDRLGNGMADTWAGHGAAIQGLPDTKKSILSWIDGRSWLIQSRIIAAVQLFSAKSDRDTDAKLDQPRLKVDPLEKLGHIPAKEGLTWSCCLCGLTWTTAAIKRVVSLGRCPGPMQWEEEPHLDCQTWRKKPGSRLTINGMEIHRTHSLEWYRGVTYCIKCGHYSSGRKLRNLAFTCRLRVAPSAKYRLNRIRTKKYPIVGGTWPKGVNEECPTFIRVHLTETLRQQGSDLVPICGGRTT